MKTGKVPGTIADLDSRVASLDFAMIQNKIVAEGEVKWTQNQRNLAEREYRRFLTLIARYPNQDVVPNRVMDTFWHYHILDTQKYEKDTKLVFGSFLHHFPYFGLRGKDDRKALHRAFKKTKELYRNTFGTPMRSPIGKYGNAGSSCSRACVSACK
ncbi:MAG: hypothetical protein DLM73_05780 [Chthoniobacterales bacterium]|nr:MAG: hypothetical protein DLM73_05780 [Chthoniobacterales bacterium]